MSIQNYFISTNRQLGARGPLSRCISLMHVVIILRYALFKFHLLLWARWNGRRSEERTSVLPALATIGSSKLTNELTLILLYKTRIKLNVSSSCAPVTVIDMSVKLTLSLLIAAVAVAHCANILGKYFI